VCYDIMNAKLFILFILSVISTPAFAQGRLDKTPTKFDSLYRREVLEARREIFKYGGGKISSQLIIDSTVKKKNMFEVSNWSTPYDSICGTKLICNRKAIYDENGNLISKSEMDREGIERLIAKYYYNNSGKIIRKTEFTDKNELYSSCEYVYDNLFNLISEKYYRPDDSFSYHTKYFYDNKGNPIQIKHIQNVDNPDYIRTSQYSYDEQNRVVAQKKVLDSSLVEEETKEYHISSRDSSISTISVSYVNGPYSDFSDTITSKTRLVEVYTKSGKLIKKTMYNGDSLFSQTLIKYDPSEKVIERLELSKRPNNYQCVNDTGWSVVKYIYDDTGRLIKNGCDMNSYFSGTTYKYNKEGKMVEKLVFRDGIVTSKHVHTYTYAK
jgi:hypothetical protein